MSLTVNQWTEMWDDVKEIERLSTIIPNSTKPMLKVRADIIRQKTQRIKRQIESVIGQME